MSHAADEATPRQAMPQHLPRTLVGGTAGGSPGAGVRRQTIVGWLFVLPALVDVRGCSSCSRSP